MQIAIIDYSIGNVQSIINAISHNRDDIKIILTSEKNKILDSDAVILPGVGAFPNAIDKLEEQLNERIALIEEEIVLAL